MTKLLGLPLVEKDWHVVQALAALARADTTPFRLVFGSGTSLSRAHRLIGRIPTQYSSRRRKVVTLRSASVRIQRQLSP
jgi:hypothetical protein